jgi:hypothetical protein
MGDLEVATKRMLETSFLGVVDRFNESLVAGQHSLRVLFPKLDCAQEPVNDSARPGSTLAERVEDFRKACDSAVFSELLRLNAMDFELLNRARAEVRRRFELIPNHDETLRRLRSREAPTEHRKSVNRRPRSIAPKVSAAPALTRMMRWLRFATHFRDMRSGSQFRRLFDADYYRESYPDVAASGANPLWHFVTRGAFEGRNPNPLFDTTFYLSQCPELPSVNALSDYLEHGHRQPHPLFDPEFYTARYPDIREARINPLFHYILHGAGEGRKPHPMFQPDYYLAVCADARNAEAPLVYFVRDEATQWCNPHPLFDGESYLREHPETAGNPLIAYLACAATSGKVLMDTSETAHFTIQDAEVNIIFPNSDINPGTIKGEIAVMWRDASGNKKFICPPQQRPFFECVRYDQLTAQVAADINRTSFVS